MTKYIVAYCSAFDNDMNIHVLPANSPSDALATVLSQPILASMTIEDAISTLFDQDISAGVMELSMGSNIASKLLG